MCNQSNKPTGLLKQTARNKALSESSDDAEVCLCLKQDANRFHEDIFGVNVQKNTEAGDKARDESQRAWKFIDTPSKPASKEVATPMPLPVSSLFVFLLLLVFVVVERSYLNGVEENAHRIFHFVD